MDFSFGGNLSVLSLLRGEVAKGLREKKKFLAFFFREILSGWKREKREVAGVMGTWIILPDHPRLRHSAIRAIPRWFEPSRSDTMEPSPRQSGRAWRSDQSRILRTLKFYSWPRRMADSTKRSTVSGSRGEVSAGRVSP